MSKRDHILVGLDIGTTKICAIVAEVPEEGPLNIIGVGSCPSRGLRKGVVVNIESTVESIKKAVRDLSEIQRAAGGEGTRAVAAGGRGGAGRGAASGGAGRPGEADTRALPEAEVMDERELARVIKNLEEQMKKAAGLLEFEQAAQIRDRIRDLRRRFIQL